MQDCLQWLEKEQHNIFCKFTSLVMEQQQKQEQQNAMLQKKLNNLEALVHQLSSKLL